MCDEDRVVLRAPLQSRWRRLAAEPAGGQTTEETGRRHEMYGEVNLYWESMHEAVRPLIDGWPYTVHGFRLTPYVSDHMQIVLSVISLP